MSIQDEHWLPKVAAWSQHWWLNLQLRGFYQSHVDNPQAGVTYVCHDFKESPCLHVPSRASLLLESHPYYPLKIHWGIVLGGRSDVKGKGFSVDPQKHTDPLFVVRITEEGINSKSGTKKLRRRESSQ